MVYLPFSDTTYQLASLLPEADLPEFAFDLFLYLQPPHVTLQAGPDCQMYLLLRDNKVVGLASFFIEGEKAYSPWRAPFGGLQVAPELPVAVTHDFIKHVHHYVTLQGKKKVKWLQCPDAYAPETNQILRQVLPELGYKLQNDQRNHHLWVTEQPFETKLHLSAKRRRRKCLKAGFKVQRENVAQLPEAYALLKQCRQEKQKPLSLSLEQLQKYFRLFPERYQLFTVRHGAALAAVGITVRISAHIVNHLYPASPRSYNQFSPTVLLTDGIYQYCQLENIAVLDLGVSAPPDESEDMYMGLFTFKDRLGGMVSWKPTFFFGEEKYY